MILPITSCLSILALVFLNSCSGSPVELQTTDLPTTLDYLPGNFSPLANDPGPQTGMPVPVPSQASKGFIMAFAFNLAKENVNVYTSSGELAYSVTRVDGDSRDLIIKNGKGVVVLESSPGNDISCSSAFTFQTKQQVTYHWDPQRRWTISYSANSAMTVLAYHSATALTPAKVLLRNGKTDVTINPFLPESGKPWVAKVFKELQLLISIEKSPNSKTPVEYVVGLEVLKQRLLDKCKVA